MVRATASVRSAGWHFPERVFGVKGLLANFFARFERETGWAPNFGYIRCNWAFVEIAVRGSVRWSVRWLSRSDFRGSRAVLFFSRRHPNTFLRESVCRLRQPAGWKRRAFSVRRPDPTRSILCDRLALPEPSQSDERSAPGAESKCHLRLATAGEGLFLVRKGRCNRYSLRFSLLLGPILALSGEAELGSAGTQPSKE